MGKKKDRKNKDEERYSLTFRGLMYGIVGDGFERAIDEIELYMRRAGYNAIVLDNGFHFTNVDRCSVS